MSQHKYTLNLLRETGKLAYKPVSTPVDRNVKLGRGEDSPVDRNSYQRLIQSQLISIIIDQIVSFLGKFMHDPMRSTFSSSLGPRVSQWIPGQTRREKHLEHSLRVVLSIDHTSI